MFAAVNTSQSGRGSMSERGRMPLILREGCRTMVPSSPPHIYQDAAHSTRLLSRPATRQQFQLRPPQTILFLLKVRQGDRPDTLSANTARMAGLSRVSTARFVPRFPLANQRAAPLSFHNGLLGVSQHGRQHSGSDGARSGCSHARR